METGLAARRYYTAGTEPGCRCESLSHPWTNSQAVRRIVHDERGTVVWDWIKETSRIAIDSTSASLKRLGVAELKVRRHPEKQRGEPRGGSRCRRWLTTLMAARFRAAKRRPPAVAPGPWVTWASLGSPLGSGATRSGGLANPRTSGNSDSSSAGGGYDPYGKGVSRKPGR